MRRCARECPCVCERALFIFLLLLDLISAACLIRWIITLLPLFEVCNFRCFVVRSGVVTGAMWADMYGIFASRTMQHDVQYDAQYYRTI